jgi:hypothetical protein
MAERFALDDWIATSRPETEPGDNANQQKKSDAENNFNSPEHSGIQSQISLDINHETRRRRGNNEAA